MYQTSGVALKSSAEVANETPRSNPPRRCRWTAKRPTAPIANDDTSAARTYGSVSPMAIGSAGSGQKPSERPTQIDAGHDQIERHPDDGRTDGDDVIRPRRLSEIRELARDVQIAVEEHAAELRKIDDPVRRHAVRVLELHAAARTAGERRAHAYRWSGRRTPSTSRSGRGAGATSRARAAAALTARRARTRVAAAA